LSNGKMAYCHQPLLEARHIRLLYLEEGFPAICTNLNGCNSRESKGVKVEIHQCSTG
jgi:hypothetical protein